VSALHEYTSIFLAKVTRQIIMEDLSWITTETKTTVEKLKAVI